MILIVYAHHEPTSFNHALLETARETLTAAGQTVEVSDLYAMGFEARASREDFQEMRDAERFGYAREQYYANRTETFAPDIAAELDKLRRCDALILQFPLWWFSMPAIMKGWIDRVFISGLCYGGRRIYDRGGLKGKSAMLAISLGGQAHMFGPGAVHGELEVMLQPILRGMLAYVGLRVLPPYVAYHVPYLEEAERRSILDGYGLHLQGLDQCEPLRFPSLDDFDETLRPL